MDTIRVAIIAEYYPRECDEVQGIWAHRQAIAAAEAGAEVRVLALNRPIPSLGAIRGRDTTEILASLKHPRNRTLDGIEIQYVPFVAPPRPWSYSTWGAWAAPTLGVALRRLKSKFPFEIIHAHYAAPAADAIRRIGRPEPLVTSVHGGDVLGIANRSSFGHKIVRSALKRSALTIANSQGVGEICTDLGAPRVEVVHLGTDLLKDPAPVRERGEQELVTVSHLVSRKRHEDVMRAIWLLRDSHPNLRWKIVGDGPMRGPLENLGKELGISERVHFLGRLGANEALPEARDADLFVLPSVDEAFGVAYIEAMSGGVPVIGCAGESGPEEIAALGDGITLVNAKQPVELAAEIRRVLDNTSLRRRLSKAAYLTVRENFTWDRCGRRTFEAYQQVLGRQALPDPRSLALSS